MISKKIFLGISLLCTTLYALESNTNKRDPVAAARRTEYSEKLKQPIEILKQVKCRPERVFEIGAPKCDCTFVSHYRFQHKATIHCVAMMEQSKVFVPLIQLADTFATFSHLHNDIFSREFLLLVFIAYRNLIVNNALKKNMGLKKNVVETIGYVYEKIDTISHEQIIEAIIFLTRELPPFLEQHEFYSDMTWHDWLTKYWWVPPFVLFVTSVNVFRLRLPLLYQKIFTIEKEPSNEIDTNLEDTGIH